MTIMIWGRELLETLCNLFAFFSVFANNTKKIVYCLLLLLIVSAKSTAHC